MRFVPNKFTLTFAALFLLPYIVIGGPTTPPPPPQGTPPGPPGTPIDSGIFVLLLISLAFGIYKIYTLNKQKASS